MEREDEKHERVHRTDIDGLRGVAVAIIVIFHLSPLLIPGGFVGVDVFFVISGFLISQRMKREMIDGSFSFSLFYKQRIRRIFPASVMCIALIMVTSVWLMTGVFTRQAIEACMASVLSSANLYFCFFVPSGYFDPGSELNPALHLWSLGVEEQFYLLWPFVMMGLTRLPTKWAVGSIFSIIAISTILGQLLFASYPSISYYMLFTRAGELAMGAVLVFSDLSAFENQYWLAEGSGLLGIFFIFGSSFLFSSKIIFPGLYSLVPCAGCALVIASGFHARTWLAAVLSQRPLVFLGLISYSVYLYHWPVLAFLRYLTVDLTGIHGVSAMLYILAASLLSYIMIEKPCRVIDWRPSLVFFVLFLIPTIVILGAGAGVLQVNSKEISSGLIHQSNKTNSNQKAKALMKGNISKGLEDVPEQLQNIEVSPGFAWGSPSCPNICNDGYGLNGLPCLDGKAENPRSVLLFGDSHAAHYVPIIHEFAVELGVSFYYSVISGCFPALDLLNPMCANNDQSCVSCVALRKIIASRIREFGVLILAARWSIYPNQEMFEAVEDLIKLALQHNGTILLLGEVPSFAGIGACPVVLKSEVDYESDLRFAHCVKQFPTKTVGHFATNSKLVEISWKYPNVGAWIGMTAYICPRGVCSAYTPWGHRLYADESHFSCSGAVEIGKTYSKLRGIPFEIERALKTIPSKGKIVPFLSKQRTNNTKTKLTTKS